MSKLSISVMIHPERQHFASYLEDNLGDVPFVYDRGKGIWDTCRRAWQQRDPQAEFHLVLQDDAIVCSDFRKRAEQTLKDGYPHSFYFGYREKWIEMAEKGLRRGEIIKRGLNWGIAICLPQKLIEPMIEFADKSAIPDHLDDMKIREFLLSQNLSIRYPMPSLVDHRSELPSFVTGKIELGRKAYRFIDSEQ